MEQRGIVGKQSGLKRGDASKIARIHRVSVQHVIEVARGNRTGRPALIKTIESYRARSGEMSREVQAAPAA